MNAQSTGHGATRRAARRVAWLLSLLWFACTPAHADGNLGGLLSDLWFAAPFNSESGWGLTVDHQDQVMFLTFYVYGPSGAPYWMVANLDHVPGTTYRFRGDLLETHGSWFGGPWSSGAFGYRTVGTATFVSSDLLNATLDYSVDGTPVHKNLVRQTLRNLNFSGTYHGAITFVTSNCANPLDNGDVISDAGPMTITHGGSSLTVAYTGTEAACTFTGTYAQSGGLGSAATTMACTSALGPIAGTMNLANMQWSAGGMSANVSGRESGCDFSGSIAGAVKTR
jgi:hypothetical protein